MKREIVFVNNSGTSPDPIGRSREATFRDITLKEEFRELPIRFKAGLTWLRFLPAVRGSIYEWMMPLDVHADMAGTTVASPRTFDPNAPSVFDAARLWFRRNHPEALSSRETNPNGLKLWPKRMGVSWVIEEQAPEGERLRLFVRSLYDGSRGGSTGLAFNLHSEAVSRDNEPGSPTAGALIHGDITAPEDGRVVKIERLPAAKNEYANYKIGIGKNPAPIGHFMALLSDKENNFIVPLETVIHIPSEEEQKEILRRYIGEKFFSEMYGTSVPAKAAQAEEEPAAATPAPKAAPAPAAEAEPVTPAPAEAPEPKAAAPAAAPAPTPEPKAVPKAEPEPEPAASLPNYTTKEVTSLLAKEKPGVEELLRNKSRLSKALMDIVLDSAKEYGVEV
jgi:hypothetical protein